MAEPLLSKTAELEYQKKCYSQCVSLSRSELRPLLDERKLLSSELLYQALKYVVSHVEKHRDYTRLGVLVELFDVRDNQLFLTYWLCDRLGLECTLDKGMLCFKPSGRQAVPDLRFKESLSAFLKQGLKRRALDVPKSEKDKKKRAAKKVDMLDSWARLPGCYGVGKRN